MDYRKAARWVMAAVFCWFVFAGSVYGEKLPGYGADLSQTSVSGMSSGAFMTAQFHVAYSGSLVGAGIVAGGPYFCAGSISSVSYVQNAMETCMNPTGPGPDAMKLFRKAIEFQKNGWIDNLKNLRDDKIYIYSGFNDEIVRTKVVDQTKFFYDLVGVPPENIRYSKWVASGHALITDNPGDVPCPESRPPFINDCDFFQAYDILNHIYGDLNPPAASLSGSFVEFEQAEFLGDAFELSGMSERGYAYVPESCEEGGCKVHVSLHGCLQGADYIGDAWYGKTGYNKMADTNKMIVLYPQAKKSEDIPYNPMGCWDFWGYSSPDPDDPNFYKKEAPQMAAFAKMLERLAQPFNE